MKTLIVLILLTVLIIIGLSYEISKANKVQKENDKKFEKFSDDCINKGNRVDSVGNIFEARFVCNPK